MRTLSEKEILIKNFKSKFKKFSRSGKCIGIYGTGKNSEYIIETLKNVINISCVIDFNTNKESFLDYKVLKKEDKIECDSIIIINRNEVITLNIFNRILPYVKDIPVYNLNGKKLKQKAINFENEIFLDKSEIQREIDRADVISFDVFDTLLTRTVYEPQDVYKLTSEKLKKDYNIQDFYQTRIEAEKKATLKYKYPNIYQIYQEASKLNPEIKEDFSEVEINIEKNVLIKRNEVVDLFNYCRDNNKEVYIISDMYLPREVLFNILKKKSIEIEIERLFVSCNMKLSKEDKTIWKFYSRKEKGKKCLHIGDNKYSDYLYPRKYKIKSILLRNPKNTFINIFGSLDSIDNNDKVVLGKLVSNLFNSPFSTKITSLEEYGYSILAPLLFLYLQWILLCEKNKKIFFFSRDGYFLVQLFNYMCKKLSLEKEGIYLNISRAFLYYINSEAIFNNQIALKFTGTKYDLLKYRFNIEEKELKDDNHIYEFNNKNIDFLDKYQESIINNAKVSKSNYIEYLKEINFFEEENIAIVDPSYKGTTQYMLEKLSNKKLHGYYCYADLSDTNPFYDKENMKAFFQKENDLTANDSSLYKYHMIFESSVMVAPNGSMLDIEDKVFVETPQAKTQQEFNNKLETFKGIKHFFETMLDDKYYSITDYLNKDIYIYIWKIVNEKNLLGDNIKESLYMDNFFDQVRDVCVF